MSNLTETIDFELAVPTLDGKGVAETRVIKLPAHRDSDTGELVLDGEALQMIDDEKARYLGLLTPAEIRGVRKRFGFTQAQIAELLQAGAKTYTRWETGRCRPSRLANVILCALRDGRIDVPYLRSVLSGPFDWRAKVVHYDFNRQTARPVTFDRAETDLSDKLVDETVAALS